MSVLKKQTAKSRVVRVDSEESWEFFTIQAQKLGLPVLVNFTTTWCMPSVQMNPIFEDLAMSYPCTLFLSVDFDEVMNTAKKMGVKAIPTFLMMRKEAILDKLVGANPQEIRKRIGAFIKSTETIHSH